MTSLIMIFGATGDLAKRKLFPSLYRLFENGRLSREICRYWSGQKNPFKR